MHTGAAGRVRPLIIAALAATAALTACHSGSSSALSSPADTASAAGTTSPGTTSAGTTSQPPASAASATSAAGAAGSGVNVCSLLTSAQASAINKVTYGAATPKQVEQGWNQCSYANKGSVDPVDIQPLNVDVISIAGCYDQLKSTVGSGTPVNGLGDAAFGYEIGLLVRTGSTCIQIEGLTHAELDGDHSGDEAIAKIVLAGLH